MKNVNELSKLVSDMVCKSLLEIIGENINSGAIVENCMTDSDFHDDLFNALRKAFPSEFANGGEVTKEQVTKWFEREDVHCQDIIDVLNDSNAMNVVSEEIQNDLVDDWFDNADADDVENKCRSYIWSEIEDNIKERCKDAIDNM